MTPFNDPIYWLAKVGFERLEEIENPELAAKRMRTIYEGKGYSEDWIENNLVHHLIMQVSPFSKSEFDTMRLNSYLLLRLRATDQLPSAFRKFTETCGGRAIRADKNKLAGICFLALDVLMSICRTLSFSTSFEASMSLVGSPMEADELLGNILGLIAHSGQTFPIVQLPDMRLASIEGFPVAVFFRLRGTNDAEIERLLVMKASLLQAA